MSAGSAREEDAQEDAQMQREGGESPLERQRVEEVWTQLRNRTGSKETTECENTGLEEPTAQDDLVDATVAMLCRSGRELRSTIRCYSGKSAIVIDYLGPFACALLSVNSSGTHYH
jgi:hypothetical protein